MKPGLPKKILVPTDFSNASREALEEAAAVAKSCSAELVVLYADPLISSPDIERELPNKFLDMNEREQKAVIEIHLKKKVEEVVPAGVHVETVVVIGSPVAAILKVANDTNADWIVMGTHGRQGLHRLVEGSVTEQVLRHADRPVLALHVAA